MLFVSALYILPFLAWANPNLGAYGGTLHLERFNPLFVATIFFINGIAFNGRALKSAFSKIKVNATIFCLCFFALPLIAYFFPKFGLAAPFQVGMVILATLPITAASCVLLTQMAGGDRFVSLFSAVATNLIGAVLTPLLLTLFLDFDALSLRPFAMIADFSYLIIVPLVLGKMASYYFPKLQHLSLRRLSELLLLLIVYAAFCTTIFQIQQLAMPLREIAVLSAHVFVLHLVFIFLAYGAGYALSFPQEDRIALLFTVPQKTVVVGIPLILALIATTPTVSFDDFAFYTLPLLIYNNLQWLTAGVLLMRRWQCNQ